MSFDGASTRIYIDGTLRTTTVGTGLDRGAWGNFFIAYFASLGAYTDYNGPSSYFKGRLDDVTLYNRALSASEITTIRDASSICWSPV